jgi:hypothetical protein
MSEKEVPFSFNFDGHCFRIFFDLGKIERAMAFPSFLRLEELPTGGPVLKVFNIIFQYLFNVLLKKKHYRGSCMYKMKL